MRHQALSPRHFLHLFLTGLFISFVLNHAVQAAAQPTTPLTQPCFDVPQLAQLTNDSQQQGTKPILIYLWSPRMVYAVTGLDQAWHGAIAQNTALIPILDARVSQSERLQALRSEASQQLPPALQALLQMSPQLCNNEVLGAETTLHWPSAIVITQGQRHPNLIRGAMPAAQWTQAIQERLSDLTTRQAMTPISASGPQNQTIPASAARPQAEPSIADQHLAPLHAASDASFTPLNHALSDLNPCIPPVQFVPLPPHLAGTSIDAYGNTQVSIGSYERISPDGRFVLRSFSGAKFGQVSLIELSPNPENDTTHVKQIIPTGLANEAFPVQGSWRYLVDVNGDHYRFKDILTLQNKAHPQFKAGMSGFYAAAAEVNTHYPSNQQKIVQIRSLSWPSSSADADNQGQGTLISKTVSIDTSAQPPNAIIIHDSGPTHHCLDRNRIDGNMYALPMISVSGAEFAALPQNPVAGTPTMRIFDFGTDGRQCIPKAQFPAVSGKAIFGFDSIAKTLTSETPINDTPLTDANLVYEYRGQVWMHHRSSGQTFNLAPWEDAQTPYRRITASAFPGITRDGRVIYAANWQHCQSTICIPQSGYIISDPYQSNAYLRLLTQSNTHSKIQPTESCIRQSQVIQAEQDFAAFHQIDVPVRHTIRPTLPKPTID